MVVIETFYKFITKTPLQYSKRLSELFKNNIYLKREDHQLTRSFKVRGVMNKIVSELYNCQKQGIICASTGNHAQGVAYVCNKFNIKADIYIPKNTPLQKIQKIKYYNSNVNIIKYSNNFNDTLNKALSVSLNTPKIFIHPYDDIKIIEGQSTIGTEILEQIKKPDYIISALGGGGLLSGIYNSVKKSKCKLVGVEPKGADSFREALKYNKPTNIRYIDRFVDGAAVSKIGVLPFDILKNNIDIQTTSNEEIAQSMVDLYNYDGIIAEPAGAMSIAGLNKLRKKKKNKKIVCVLSGGNNDIYRYSEIIDIYKKK